MLVVENMEGLAKYGFIDDKQNQLLTYQIDRYFSLDVDRDGEMTICFLGGSNSCYEEVCEEMTIPGVLVDLIKDGIVKVKE